VTFPPPVGTGLSAFGLFFPFPFLSPSLRKADLPHFMQSLSPFPAVRLGLVFRPFPLPDSSFEWREPLSFGSNRRSFFSTFGPLTSLFPFLEGGRSSFWNDSPPGELEGFFFSPWWEYSPSSLSLFSSLENPGDVHRVSPFPRGA